MLTLCDEFKAIWDDPEADGPRLAVAHRLEGSEPLRAQFIRGQVLCEGSADATADCFEKAGQHWLDRILSPLGFDVGRLYVQHYSPSWRACAQGHVTVSLWSEEGIRTDGCSPICWERGFVSCLNLNPSREMRLAPALTAEPIDSLNMKWNDELQGGLWSRLTVPAIAQIRHLSLSWKSGEAADFSSLYEDHWPGLVDLEVGCWANGLSPTPLPASVLARLGRSDWPQKLRRLTVFEPTGEGMQRLLEGDWRQLESLEVSSFDELDPDEVPVAWDRLPASLRELDLYDFALGDEGLRRFAQARLPNLRTLRVAGARFTRQALGALLDAPFTETLESLDLSRNGLSREDLPEPWRSRVQLQ